MINDIFEIWYLGPGTYQLTHNGLETPYSDVNLGKRWFMWWFVPWWHQAISCTNVDLSSGRSSDIHFRAISSEITLNFHSNLPWAIDWNARDHQFPTEETKHYTMTNLYCNLTAACHICYNPDNWITSIRWRLPPRRLNLCPTIHMAWYIKPDGELYYSATAL